MARAKNVTPEKKSLIKAMAGVLTPEGRKRYTQREIAESHRVTQSVVSKIIRDDGSSPQGTRGAPKKLTDGCKRRIVRELLKAPGSSCDDLVRNLSLPVCRETVRLFLVGEGAKYAPIKAAPVLKAHHKVARVNWARQYLTKNEGFENFVFTDEKKFNLDGPDGVYCYWRFPGGEEMVRSKRSFGGGSLMVWGAIVGRRKLCFSTVDGRLNSEKYQEMLEQTLLPALEDGMIFQQDNASCHASRSTKAWLEARRVTTCTWPALSPDLNPIENVWGQLARLVYKPGQDAYMSVKDLEAAVHRAWGELSEDFVSSCTESMRKRLCAVLEKNGGAIDF